MWRANSESVVDTRHDKMRYMAGGDDLDVSFPGQKGLDAGERGKKKGRHNTQRS